MYVPPLLVPSLFSLVVYSSMFKSVAKCLVFGCCYSRTRLFIH
ncbi:hypothetical protein OIU76_006418 [Salix suchowensis]|uniref:Uncharacterized protein n=1 Tax=Salix suchowensis TaxID=1278906 RepID=A0ABQ9A5U2_9ROSI|nr:hypothetical protein OIU77_009704 [Salix suchowensis]KAJ6336533.1 hypothetical protein OIU76_006418 [Salix suchowensis]